MANEKKVVSTVKSTKKEYAFCKIKAFSSKSEKLYVHGNDFTLDCGSGTVHVVPRIIKEVFDQNKRFDKKGKEHCEIYCQVMEYYDEDMQVLEGYDENQ